MMKALSLWQPWASLVIVGAKQYETRSWKTSYRGTLVIHAALKWDAELETHAFHFKAHLGAPLDAMPRGVALGTVELVEIITTEDALFKEGIDARERQFGDYSSGRWAWRLANPIAFPEPILCAGHQRLWEVE
jgi:hypothetical protein